jgi:hypothetical protein
MAGAEKMKTPLVIFILALAVVLFACASPAAASDETIHNGETRYVDSGETLTINSGETLTIESGGQLIVNNTGVIENYGTINNCGTINNDGFVNNYGTINNGGTINNDGQITNYGIGIINNCGTINNDGDFYNYGTINNYEGGIFSGTGTVQENEVTYLSDPCPFRCPCGEVPALTPIGLVALVGLLCVIAAVTLVRKRR